MGGVPGRSCFSSDSGHSDFTGWASSEGSCDQTAHVHMLDLECWETSEDALGTPEPEPEPLGSVRDLVSLSGACEHYSPPSPLQCPDDGGQVFGGNLEDDFKVMFWSEARTLVDPRYLEEHHSVSSAVRLELVRWMIRAAHRYKFDLSTTSLATNLLDRYFALNKNQVWENWVPPLAAVACLSIAAKHEEMNLPTNLQCVQVDVPWGSIFTATNIMDMELIILEALHWRLAAVTPVTFAERLIQMLPSFPGEYQGSRSVSSCDSSTRHQTTVNYKGVRQDARRYLYFAVQDPAFLRYRPSSIACAAVLRALSTRLSNCAVEWASKHFKSFCHQIARELDDCRQQLDETYAKMGVPQPPMTTPQAASFSSQLVDTPQQHLEWRAPASRGSITPTHPRPAGPRDATQDR
eukprot:jgi/Botrbrau1/21338/Bobra.0184s0048.1